MIPFFRQLRRKVFAGNQLGRYLLYALGEILLVVIGILIALQVNNWNQQRIERRTERAYLQRLLEEIESDLESVSRSVETNERRKKRAEFLMASKSNPALIEEDPTYFIESIEYAGYTNSPVISDHTFEEIKSSGRLSIISNEEIRTGLSKYYASVQNRGQYNFIIQDIQLRYLEYRAGILSDEQQIAMGSFSSKTEYETDVAWAVYERMMSNANFIGHLPFVIQSKIRTGENLKNRLDAAALLGDMIRDELNLYKH